MFMGVREGWRFGGLREGEELDNQLFPESNVWCFIV